MFSRRGGRTAVGSLLWAPYSAMAFGATLGWMGFLFASSLPIMAFRRFETFQLKWPHPQTGWPVRLTFSRFRVTVDPAYDRGRVSVFAQNHVSVLDANIACASIRVPFCGLENASHLKVPGYGWLLRAANAIPVEKGTGNYGAVAEAFRERASRGISVLTFPEAHRTLDGKLRPFKRGVFKIACDAGLPIVPLCVRGAFRMLPKGAWTLRPSNVEVYIAPQIETAGLTEDQLPELMQRVRTVMEAWIERGEMLGELCTRPFAPGGSTSAMDPTAAE